MVVSRGDAIDSVGCEIHIKEKHGGMSGDAINGVGVWDVYKERNMLFSRGDAFNGVGCEIHIKREKWW